MADTVTIATTENKVTVQTVGQDLVTLTSPAADQVTVALGVGPVSLAGQTTDSLGEGSTNLYFSNARASAAAPVQSVVGSTGMNILTNAQGDVSVTNTKLGTVTGVTMPSGYAVADVSGALTVSYNNLAAVRTDLGLVPGTSANQIVQLDGSAKLPAVDGSALTNLPSAPTFGIANTNAVKVDSTSVADDEYARFTASGLESRSASEVLADIGAAAASHTQSATTITTGELGVDRIPALAASKITSGTLGVDRIPSLSTDKLTSGTLPVARGGTGLTSVSTLLNSNTTKNDVGLGNVENTAVSTSITTHNNITTAHGISTFGATLVDDADAAAARTTLGAAATNHTHAASQLTGDMPDARIVASNVTQHAAQIDVGDLGNVTHAAGLLGAGSGLYWNGSAWAAGALQATSVPSLSAYATAAHTHTDSYAMFITAPADKASPGYVVDARVASARTITNFYVKTESGSCVATLRNITDNVEIASATADNTGASDASLINTGVTANERLGVVITSNSSAVDLQIVVEYTA